uniref:Uncharacterized protein n=1 Tax=Peronospora matthiolae TaxID=2874970 RepID=A0AAV1UWS1_9STRA
MSRFGVHVSHAFVSRFQLRCGEKDMDSTTPVQKWMHGPIPDRRKPVACKKSGYDRQTVDKGLAYAYHRKYRSHEPTFEHAYPPPHVRNPPRAMVRRLSSNP